MYAEDSAIDWDAIDTAGGLESLISTHNGDMLNWRSDTDGGEFEYIKDGDPEVTDDDGVVHRYEYYASTDATASSAGGVKGYVRYEQVECGDGYTDDTTPITLIEYKYKRNTDGSGDKAYYVAERYEYLDTNGPTKTASLNTSTSCVFSGTDVTDRTITSPVGEGDDPIGTLVTIEVLDNAGHVRWRCEAMDTVEYNISYFNYNNGRLVKWIEDVDTSQTSDFDGNSVPSGWATATGSGSDYGLHLMMVYTYDDAGRMTEELGPPHYVDTDGDGDLEAAQTAYWSVYEENDLGSVNER